MPRRREETWAEPRRGAPNPGRGRARDRQGHRPKRRERRGNYRRAVSKWLSLARRHTAKKWGIDMAKNGYCKLDEVLADRGARDLGATEQIVLDVVEKCKKQRFAVKKEDGQYLIRCTRGHSQPVASPLRPS